MWLEAVPESEDIEEKCPTCGGCVQRRDYGEMHAGSFILDGERVEIRKKPREGFIDTFVVDPITQLFEGKIYRIFPSSEPYYKNQKYLHRVVWESAFGKIPGRCHIHHRDGNPANNLLWNLECVDGAEHQKREYKKRVAKGNQPREFSDEARNKAAEWHRSEEGREWHRRNAKRTKAWTKWKREEKPCTYCGKPYMALVRKSGISQKYCSQKCKSLAYRERRKSQQQK